MVEINNTQSANTVTNTVTNTFSSSNSVSQTPMPTRMATRSVTRTMQAAAEQLKQTPTVTTTATKTPMATRSVTASRTVSASQTPSQTASPKVIQGSCDGESCNTVEVSSNNAVNTTNASKLPVKVLEEPSSEPSPETLKTWPGAGKLTLDLLHSVPLAAAISAATVVTGSTASANSIKDAVETKRQDGYMKAKWQIMSAVAMGALSINELISINNRMQTSWFFTIGKSVAEFSMITSACKDVVTKLDRAKRQSEAGEYTNALSSLSKALTPPILSACYVYLLASNAFNM